MGCRSKEGGGQGAETCGDRRSGERDLYEQGTAAGEEDERANQEDGQHCCYPAFSFASRYVKYDMSKVIR